jgi:hypothetical protein
LEAAARAGQVDRGPKGEPLLTPHGRATDHKIISGDRDDIAEFSVDMPAQ